MIKAAIIGATGYTGLELIKILLNHPKAEIQSLMAKIDKPKIKIADEFPALQGKTNLTCYNFDLSRIPTNIDVVFLAVPHRVAISLAAHFIKKNIKVIDLSADFRLTDPKVYKKWYEKTHTEPKLLKQAIYGLPELNANKIKKTKLLANPGCFPTGTILGTAPALKNKLVTESPIYINAITGTSGAGRKAALGLIFSECANNIKPYKVLNHQHQPEIEQELSTIAGKKTQICFVPSLAPVNRGILTTIFMKLNKKTTTKKAINLYKQFYKKSPFTIVLNEGIFPELKNVVDTNFCHLGLKVVGKELIVITAIDNLLKGAAGQAVQNMNLMFNCPEEMGLK